MAESSETHILPQSFRAGYVAVLGLPNAGKSTLMNQLLEYKLSIVTRKPQTTRKSVLGILNEEGYQAVFIDTPGIIKPRYDLQEAMMGFVKTAIDDADVIVYLVDVKDRRQKPEDVKEQLAAAKGKQVILALNKVDLIDKKQVLPLITQYNDMYPFRAVIPISGLKNKGLDILLEEMLACLPFSPPYYPTDYISDQQERFFVAEIIREKIFKLYAKEIPYSCHVEIEEFREAGPASGDQPERKKDYIRAIIYVEKKSQKGILIGKQGLALRKVGEFAREDIEVFLDRPVFLEMFVKVAADWRKKEAMLKIMGYQ